MKKVARRLTEEREKLGYNQQGTAALAGVSQRAFSRWENGEIPQQWVSLYLLAEGLNVSTDYLLALTDNPDPRNEIPPEVLELHEILMKLSPIQRSALLLVARSMTPDEVTSANERLEQQEILLDLIEDVYGEEVADQVIDVLLGSAQAGSLASALRRREQPRQ